MQHIYIIDEILKKCISFFRPAFSSFIDAKKMKSLNQWIFYCIMLERLFLAYSL